MKSKRFWILAGLMTASFLAGSWLTPRIRIEWEPGRLPNQAAAAPERPAVTADEPVARSVSLVSPAVVNIDTVRRVVEEDWFFGPQTYESRGAGSGVVIDSRGHILTNDHVVARASQIRVTFGNGKQYPGRVLGTDHETDVGVIQLLDTPPNLAVAKQGDSRNLVPGQWAIAIGNPYGYQQTVTLGVIGHAGRAVRVDDRVYKRLIQTDAAINPGNSGGALCNIRGEVVGINTVVRSDAQGIGFAIPIDLARSIADELIRVGKIKRPWTGLNVRDVTADLAAYLGLDRAEGALVDQIDRRGPAWAAGIRPGDVLREIGGRKVRGRADVEAALSGIRIGQKLPLVVEREGQRFRGELTVSEKP